MKLAETDAERLRAIAAQFPEIRDHATALLEGPPPEPEPDLGYPMQDRCGCGPQPDDQPVQFHRRGSPECRAETPD